MKLKALLLLLLALTGSSSAMQLPTKEPVKKEATNLVDPDDICNICLETAKRTSADQRHITNCCNKFICKNDADEIYRVAQINSENYQTAEQQAYFIAVNGFAPKNVLKAICPRCREDFATRPAKIAFDEKASLEIIGVDGTAFTLEPELTQTFLQCTNLKKFTINPGKLDFSTLDYEKYKICQKFGIMWLVELMNNPKHQLNKFIRVLPLFEIAHYLGAPDNILYLLANEMWPLMQEEANDSQERKEYKKYLRPLARPYLASPKHFLNYLKENPYLVERLNPQGTHTFNLSYTNLKGIIGENCWYSHNDTDWYIDYPFRSLDGISELLTLLKVSEDRSWNLHLTHHQLETFSCDMIKSIDTINLSYNNIKQLSHVNLKYSSKLPRAIILDNNPISSIDDSFFAALTDARSIRNGNFTISLVNNNLSNALKTQIETKFNKATTPLPQRYLNKYKFDDTFLFSNMILGGLGSVLAAYYFSQKAPHVAKGICLASSVAIGGAIATSRELVKSSHEQSKTLMLTDSVLGASISYLAADYLYNKSPWAIKAIPFAISGITGAVLGFISGGLQAHTIATGLSKLTHPKIPWRENLAWNNGSTYTIKL